MVKELPSNKGLISISLELICLKSISLSRELRIWSPEYITVLLSTTIFVI